MNNFSRNDHDRKIHKKILLQTICVCAYARERERKREGETIERKEHRNSLTQRHAISRKKTNSDPIYLFVFSDHIWLADVWSNRALYIPPTFVIWLEWSFPRTHIATRYLTVRCPWFRIRSLFGLNHSINIVCVLHQVNVTYYMIMAMALSVIFFTLFVISPLSRSIDCQSRSFIFSSMRIDWPHMNVTQ